MKKILVLVMVALLVFVLPIIAYAEEAATAAVATEGVEAGKNTTSTESATEGLISPPTDTSENEDFGSLISKQIEEWVIPHIEEISVVITLIASSFYQRRKHKVLNKSIGVLNNNSVSLAETSTSLMNTALEDMKGVSGVVECNSAVIEKMLEEYKQTAEEKKQLEDLLMELNNHLTTSKQANIEFANELAELLILANIPNSKKEELYSRHLAAVNSIAEADAEEKARHEGVKHHDGEET